jgi:hypothetical protein
MDRLKENNQNFSTIILVDKSPEDVFNIINNVHGWWSARIKGNTVNLHDEFMVDFGSHWWAFKIIEAVPGQKMVWQVTGSYMPWNEDQHEWTGTRVSFEISTRGAETQVRFTHIGLVPKFSCFQGCSKGWTGYIDISLKNLINIGTPDVAY